MTPSISLNKSKLRLCDFHSSSISYTIPSGGEFGVIHLMENPSSPVDLALEVIKHGWAKLRDSSGKFGEAGDVDDGADQERRNKLKEYEEKAKEEGLGIWADSKPVCCSSPCAYPLSSLAKACFNSQTCFGSPWK